MPQKVPENRFLFICCQSMNCVFFLKVDKYLDLVFIRHHGHAESRERVDERAETKS